MLCEHGNVAPCFECDIAPLKAENEALQDLVAELSVALEKIANMDSMSYHSLDSAKITARKALAAYRQSDKAEQKDSGNE